MEKINKKQSFYEKPKLEVIHLTETDIITTSGDGKDYESEIMPVQNSILQTQYPAGLQ